MPGRRWTDARAAPGPLSVLPLADVLLHLSTDHLWVPRPPESHHIFGAGFFLLGFVLLMEAFAGGVWYRSRLRTLIFPVTLVLLGWGMLAVTVIEPEARIAHFAMGLPMTIGGWAEARHRFGHMSRRRVDAFLVPALLFAALETGLFHVDPPLTGADALIHSSLALTALLIALLRYYQSFNVTSLGRSVAIACAVLLVGFELNLDGFLQE